MIKLSKLDGKVVDFLYNKVRDIQMTKFVSLKPCFLPRRLPLKLYLSSVFFSFLTVFYLLFLVPSNGPSKVLQQNDNLNGYSRNCKTNV